MTVASPSTGVLLTGPSLPVETCARRLRALGAWDRRAVATDGSGHGLRELALRPGSEDEEDLRASIAWHPASEAPSARQPASEVTIQAMCGLMAVHGRDAGRPRRLGLEVASVASGVLTAQAVLAALVARSRGRTVSAVETSVLEAGLVLVSHYVAAATCEDAGEWSPPEGGPDPGPPFRSADGRWFEIETLNPEAWREFWSRLGAADADLGHAWTSFRARYFRGHCSLPGGLQQATARHGFEDLAAAAAACRVSLTLVRGLDEVLADPELAGGHPELRDGAGSSREAPAPVTDSGGELPLEGIEVVEATSRMQGPLAGLLLAMLGAHVVRIEPPGGDPIRLVPPYAGDQGYFFSCFNRGKDSLELDLAAPADRASALELAAGADVFLHNWGPGRAAEWGLDPDVLADLNPRLTYVQASGWGDVQLPGRPVGTDFLVQAHAGMGHTLNPDDEPPAPSRVLLTDCLGALVTCEGALAALHRREQTGRGCRADASLLAGGMTLQAHVLGELTAGRESSRRAGRPVWGPLDRPLETDDGFILVDAAEDATLSGLCRVCDVALAGASRSAVEAAICERIRTGLAARWEQALCEQGIPCAAVCTDLASLPQDPRLASLFESLPGTCRAPAAPWRFCP